ncbi:hypothetical protein BCR44DRAFT_32310 [Catenaria anguillulae PL171]|uniref:Uncharacterized protein n=1 Tax=Catenaria anguillulae PL171 TaxID=765915 RepID=A0A1Y2H562_9FUNG|nr:hypothetical protein BCR44DRAFT_32310 [Catenaria anguillulae PL171]
MSSIVSQYPAAFLALASICAQTGGDFGGGFAVSSRMFDDPADPTAFRQVLHAVGLKEDQFHVTTTKVGQHFNAKGKFGMVPGPIPDAVLASSPTKEIAKRLAIMALMGEGITTCLGSQSWDPNPLPKRSLAHHLARFVIGLQLRYPLALRAQTPVTAPPAAPAPLTAATIKHVYASQLRHCDLGTRTMLAHVPVQSCLDAGLSIEWATAVEVDGITTITVFADSTAFAFADSCPFRAFAGACQARFLAAQETDVAANEASEMLAAAAEDSRKRAREVSGSTASGPTSPAAPTVPPRVLLSPAAPRLLFGSVPASPVSSPVAAPNTPTRSKPPSKMRRLEFPSSSPAPSSAAHQASPAQPPAEPPSSAAQQPAPAAAQQPVAAAQQPVPAAQQPAPDAQQPAPAPAAVAASHSLHAQTTPGLHSAPAAVARFALRRGRHAAVTPLSQEGIPRLPGQPAYHDATDTGFDTIVHEQLHAANEQRLRDLQDRLDETDAWGMHYERQAFLQGAIMDLIKAKIDAGAGVETIRPLLDVPSFLATVEGKALEAQVDRHLAEIRQGEQEG